MPTTITVNSTTTSVADSLMKFANANTSSDTLDIKVFANHNDEYQMPVNIHNYSEMQVIQHANYLTAIRSRTNNHS